MVEAHEKIARTWMEWTGANDMGHGTLVVATWVQLDKRECDFDSGELDDVAKAAARASGLLEPVNVRLVPAQRYDLSD